MKKNLIATALAVFMAFPFVSCNKQNDKKESTKADAVENQAENENSAATENPEPVQENKDTLFVSSRVLEVARLFVQGDQLVDSRLLC